MQGGLGMQIDYVKNSYVNHEKHYNAEDEAEWTRRIFLLTHHNCAQYKIIIRTLEPLRAILQSNNTWLTVGDYNGLEAQYFEQHGQSVVASDIADTFLSKLNTLGMVGKFAKVNVEQIPYADCSFDFVSCREAYHHFPRAFIGLYEMIRIARKGVVIIEPSDAFLEVPFFLLLKHILDRINPLLINKFWKNRFSWETVGNYVFKLSEREVEKIAMGMGLPCIALHRMNHRLSPTPKDWGNPTAEPIDLKLMKRYKRSMWWWNLLCKLSIIPYNTICAIIFKQIPEQTTINALKTDGWRIIMLPPNPYIEKN